MRVQRFSAIEQFGVPLYDLEAIQTLPGLLQLMRQYDITGTDIPEKPTDITPPYWDDNKFRYVLSQPHPGSPAVVELFPVFENSKTLLLTTTSEEYIETPLQIRRIEIPTDMPALPLAGPGARFMGQLCLHELVIQTES